MRRRWALGALLAMACGPTDLPEVVTYDADIAPLYAEACVRCHELDVWEAGAVALDDYHTARSTRVRAACTASHPDLIAEYPEVFTSDAAPEPVPCHAWTPYTMPPDGAFRLSSYEQRLLVRWIQLDAPE